MARPSRVRQDDRDGHRTGLTSDERQRLTALEREVVELEPLGYAPPLEYEARYYDEPAAVA
jgi:hypothetical protein